MKSNKFISGNEYCLHELLGSNTKIIIPDLQRDYCWGDNAHVASSDKKPRELVSDFIKNIVELYEENKELKTTLGLIYGYEQPHNHIQICDGQQRLTTLFLLLGYINIKTKGTFDDYIISEEERNDDYEPHLLYAIRESTLYFLSDLSKNVFIERATTIADIKQSNWYFNEYDQDASIQSMVTALTTIDNYFEHTELEYEALGHFILNNLRVLYYDMENRSQGEETYVVINTTGEPLSAAENIKPILLGRLPKDQIDKYSNQWEEREDWFWQNKGEDRTADTGMQEFFVWYWQIGLIQENKWSGEEKMSLNPKDLFTSTPKKIKENANEVKLSTENYTKFQHPDNLDKYFKGLQKLVEEICNSTKLQQLLLSIRQKKGDTMLNSKPAVWNWFRHADLDIVLPLITLVTEHGCKMLYPFMRRLRKNHFDRIWGKSGNEQSRRGKNYMDWRYLVQIINQTTDDNLLTADTDILNIIKIPNINMPKWYNDDEQNKDILRKLSDHQSPSIDEMEDNEFLMSDLTPLWKRKGIEKQGFAMESILKRWNLLEKICNSLDEKNAVSDIQFSNWFRLYRLVSGLIVLHHIDYCSWDFEGCYYSMKPSTPWWIECKEINNLMECKDPLLYMKNYVKDKTRSFIYEPSDYKELVISWMTIKTIQAEKGDYLINFWNSRAISAFLNMEKNYIIPIDKFHWGNVLCGYSYSYTIYPARDEYNWEKKSNLDSPITSLAFIPDYYHRTEDIIDMETILNGDNEVLSIINGYLSLE